MIVNIRANNANLEVQKYLWNTLSIEEKARLSIQVPGDRHVDKEDVLEMRRHADQMARDDLYEDAMNASDPFYCEEE